MTTIDRLPPQNIEMEQWVIGSMLLDNEAINEVADLVVAEDFYRDVHQVLFRVILEVHSAGKPVDALILIDELTRRGDFDRAGGDQTIRDVMERTPSAANARYHAYRIKQLSISRSVIEAANRILREGYSNSLTSDELLQLAEREIFAIGQRRMGREPIQIDKSSVDAMVTFHDRRSNPRPPGLRTLFSDLDAIAGGFHPGNMIVLAARPSMGKTAIGLGIASNVAGTQAGVLFISLEMNHLDITNRFLSMRSGVAMKSIQNPRSANDEDIIRLDEATPPAGFPLWIEDSPGLSPTQISAMARRFKARHGIGLVVVDYLQRITPDDHRRPRQEQVADMSRRLKALALELGSPVLVLAQLNRDVEKRTGEDKRPRLADLRESGQIEQDADIVMLLHRPEYYKPEDYPGIAELIVAKNRNGATGTVKLSFKKQSMCFSDIESDLAF